MNSQTIRIALHQIRYTLDRKLADLREDLLQAQAGRAILDEMPDTHRRMLKHATWTL